MSAKCMDSLKTRVAEHFGNSAEIWRSMYGDTPVGVSPYYVAFMKQRREVALRMIASHAAGRTLRVLDIGCGAGPLASELVKVGHEVVGVDLAVPMLKRAASAMEAAGGGRRAMVARADAERLPFADGTFDVVTCMGLVEYLPGDDGIVAEVRRVLRPGGLWVMSAPNLLKAKSLLDPYYYLVRAWQYARVKLGGKGATVEKGAKEAVGFNEDFSCRRFVRGHWPAVAARAGFDFRQREGIGYGPFSFWQKDVLGPRRMLKLSAALDRLADVPGMRWLDCFSNRWVYAFIRCG